MKHLPTLLGITLIAALLTGGAAAELYNRAPETVPGTLPEMRNPAYWIARMAHPDEVILTLDQIRARNATYLSKINAPAPFAGVHAGRAPDEWQLNRWPGRFIVPPALITRSETYTNCWPSNGTLGKNSRGNRFRYSSR